MIIGISSTLLRVVFQVVMIFSGQYCKWRMSDFGGIKRIPTKPDALIVKRQQNKTLNVNDSTQHC